MIKFGKIENGGLRIAPCPLPYEGRVHFNPRAELYEKAGYLPIRETEPPAHEAGVSLRSEWREDNGRILQIWRKERAAIDVEADVGETSSDVEARLAALTEENAAIRAELAALRAANNNELE